ncbi:hypothetical protein Sxan_01250 [Streptomyces xanthophaeus]|uniref:Uncharacterized protein n=1 Tax=Streptomyces xanthophaeus TaxID=67385 RepID=A0A919LB01_9ACTN|nr:hypothetical protein Sxan_01250 [Streptomyces xanthophaeus]
MPAPLTASARRPLFPLFPLFQVGLPSPVPPWGTYPPKYRCPQTPAWTSTQMQMQKYRRRTPVHPP